MVISAAIRLTHHNIMREVMDNQECQGSPDTGTLPIRVHQALEVLREYHKKASEASLEL